jgi:hypothetical protein
VGAEKVTTSLYCHDCGGDRLYGTCSCCEFCPDCGGCVSCGLHEKGCRLIQVGTHMAREIERTPHPDGGKDVVVYEVKSSLGWIPVVSIESAGTRSRVVP